MKTKLYNKREELILKIQEKMFKLHEKFYSNKKTDWQLKREELLQMPGGSVGHELGLFLVKQNFHSIPKLERHDIFHLLFGFDIHVKDEIAMLCFLVGNGKITLFTTLSSFGSALFFPEHWLYFIKHFNRGRNAINVSKWDFRPFLTENMSELREAIFLRQAPFPSVRSKIKIQLLKTSPWKLKI